MPAITEIKHTYARYTFTICFPPAQPQLLVLTHKIYI